MRRLDTSCLWTGRDRKTYPDASLLIDDDGLIRDIREGPSTGNGLFAMPSFVDSHCHFTWMGLAESLPDLSGVSSSGEMLAVLSRENGTGEGILQCERFDESEWSTPGLPTLAELDAATGSRPAFVRRVCGHKALVNSAMLALLPPETPDLDRSSGVLTEDYVINWNRYFPRSDEEMARAVRCASSMAFTAGVTGIGTMESWRSIRHITATGSDVRLSANVMYQDLDSCLEELPLDTPDDIRVTGVKLFLDGALGARNAAVAEGYVDAPPGKLIYSDRELTLMLQRIRDIGLVPVVHAIGGGALLQLDRISSMVLTPPEGEDVPGMRVEHAEELLPAWPGTWNPSLHAFSMQPNFVARWQQPGGLYQQRLRLGDALRLNPFALVLENGFRLGFGSDNMPFGPLKGLDGATDHPDPGSRLTCQKALEAYTLGSAWLCGLHELARPLGRGRTADLAVLSGNPFENGFSDLEVVATLRGGRIVHGPPDLLSLEE